MNFGASDRATSALNKPSYRDVKSQGKSFPHQNDGTRNYLCQLAVRQTPHDIYLLLYQLLYSGCEVCCLSKPVNPTSLVNLST
jgi:hypothetical protein